MAAGTLPKPGTKLGPCKGPCEHEDCRETREMAELACKGCGDPIGYGQAFFNHREKGVLVGLIHARCLG